MTWLNRKQTTARISNENTSTGNELLESRTSLITGETGQVAHTIQPDEAQRKQIIN